MRSRFATLARRLGVVPSFALCLTACARSHAPAVPGAEIAPPAVRDLPLTAQQRQAFIGTYSVTLPPQGEKTVLRVFEENGVLKARPGNQDETRRLLYQGNGVFAVEGVADFSLTFFVQNGRATKFTGHKADGVMEGERIE